MAYDRKPEFIFMTAKDIFVIVRMPKVVLTERCDLFDPQRMRIFFFHSAFLQVSFRIDKKYDPVFELEPSGDELVVKIVFVVIYRCHRSERKPLFLNPGKEFFGF